MTDLEFLDQVKYLVTTKYVALNINGKVVKRLHLTSNQFNRLYKLAYPFSTAFYYARFVDCSIVHRWINAAEETLAARVTAKLTGLNAI